VKPTVYIETTIPSYLCSRPSRDLIVAAHQELTREWWERDRANYRLCISEFVYVEIDRGDQALAASRRQALVGVPLLPVTDEAHAIARCLLHDGLVPPKAVNDALHVALATVHLIDYLLTWNCKHLNNAAIKRRLADWMTPRGLLLPVICTPDELREVPDA
jgi:predicted nucleic acid-binding protein